ncbi:unnamed protein product [Chironomus riparius]|uniref:Uncharacterized protein n=1 Tax=Chironomus riparius TaxID=315576 RepID=A0A9N9RSI1_9DIPT|nr:unnamed protein product [Chironomus riparius]
MVLSFGIIIVFCLGKVITFSFWLNQFNFFLIFLTFSASYIDSSSKRIPPLDSLKYRESTSNSSS